MWQETAGLRDFSPLYARFGSESTELVEAIGPFMSAMAPIATDSVCHNDLSRSASKRRLPPLAWGLSDDCSSLG
jgi:hypothetical protein